MTHSQLFHIMETYKSEEKQWAVFMFGLKLPGKEKSLLSTVRAMDCSLTTSMDCPMCTVDGMLPSVPRTNSATSCTVNICSSSSKMAGNEFNRAAWGRRGRDEGEWRGERSFRGGGRSVNDVSVCACSERKVTVTSFCNTRWVLVNPFAGKKSQQD